ncbi:hypothetical protein ACH5RR_022826 [Cinchona calisaya]|uniref:Uncharacterized protein n=1 Tax=Cinchona calisaya TaxID=153742 RepID=A0ABD2Z8Y9_9GENT
MDGFSQEVKHLKFENRAYIKALIDEAIKAKDLECQQVASVKNDKWVAEIVEVQAQAKTKVEATQKSLQTHKAQVKILGQNEILASVEVSNKVKEYI